MKLTVQFHLVLTIHTLEKNYSGVITLNPPGLPPQAYYFFFLNPYGGTDSELSIFTDERHMHPFAEAVGAGTRGVNPRTHMPVTVFDFSALEDDLEKTAVTFVITQILSEGVYRAELEWKDKTVAMRANERPTVIFSHIWEQNFVGDTEQYGGAFLKAFGKK